MTGRLIAIARRAKPRLPMESLTAATVTVEAGVEGDIRGRPGDRQVTVLAIEAFKAAVADVPGADPASPWTMRRANLLVEGIDLPKQPGALLTIGTLTLEITGETEPCERMDAQLPGLTAALTPDWRGGVTCRVLASGRVAIGDGVGVGA
jgi:MOSC domain-containing protein YiiM